MQGTIEILLILGIIINLIKGADLILRPHQQKWIQDKFDTFTLWLDYSRPLNWYNTRRVGGITLGAGFRILTIVGIISIALDHLSWITASVALIVCSAIVISFVRAQMGKARPVNQDGVISVNQDIKPSKLFFPIRINDQLVDWLFKSKDIWQYLLRTFLTVLLALVLILIIYIALQGLFYSLAFVSDLTGINIKINRVNLIVTLMLLIIPLLIYFGIVVISMPLILTGAASLFPLISSVLFLMFEAVLKIIRGIVWRAAEYNKGAFAAIVLLVTVVLGIVEFYLKYGKK